jgi:hypothetical protein
MSSTTKDKRTRRIERRGTRALVQAMLTGQISVRTADSLFICRPKTSAFNSNAGSQL